MKTESNKSETEAIVLKLEGLFPAQLLNEWFLAIVNEGIGKRFEMEMNAKWLQGNRPIVEVFLRVKYFLEMIGR